MRRVISQLDEASVVIDCGAHVGLASLLFARKAGTVYAIEPHPAAFETLVINTKSTKAILPINAAATTTDQESSKLFLHVDTELDEVTYASGSSLLASKPNVSSNFVTVPSLNLVEFVLNLNRVDLLKLDVEGYETQIIPSLIQSQAMESISNVFVETHDRKWESLRKETQQMLKEVRESNYAARFHWGWP